MSLVGHDGCWLTVRVGSRFRTGQLCLASGVYAHDGYLKPCVDDPRPTPESETIPLARGERFPPCMKRGALWRLVAPA